MNNNLHRDILTCNLPHTTCTDPTKEGARPPKVPMGIDIKDFEANIFNHLI